MFMEQEPPNLQSAGICFNNIGNIQFKNGSFDMAYDNFKEAVRCAKECKAVTLNLAQRSIRQNVNNWPQLNKELQKMLLEEDEWIYFSKVEAHRTYLRAMSKYKLKRYTTNKLAKKLTWFDIDQDFI